MNFGTIKGQVEIDIGAAVPASTMGRWINAAQKEVAKRYGKRIRAWYPPTLTTISADIEPGAVQIPFIDGIALPEPPASIIIGDGGLYETITYQTADHIFAFDVTRGANSTTALAWPSGTPVRAMPTASKEYMLPDNLLTLHDVRDLSNNPIFKYTASPDNKITVLVSGMYFIIYTRVPEPIDITDNEAELEIHPVFYDDVVVFCLHRYWQQIAEAIPGEENKSQILLNEFTRSVDSSAKHLKRNENQQYTIGYELP